MNSLVACVLAASVGQASPPVPEAPRVNARDTAVAAVAEATAERWNTAATLARAAVGADAHALFAYAAAEPQRAPVADLIVTNQQRLVRGPLDADMVFLQATLYVLIGDGPSARYALLLLSELEDDSPEAAKLRALLAVPAEPELKDAASPVEPPVESPVEPVAASPAEPPVKREPVDYQALRGRIGHMSSLLERFSQKLMRRLESRVSPALASE